MEKVIPAFLLHCVIFTYLQQLFSHSNNMNNVVTSLFSVVNPLKLSLPLTKNDRFQTHVETGGKTQIYLTLLHLLLSFDSLGYATLSPAPLRVWSNTAVKPLPAVNNGMLCVWVCAHMHEQQLLAARMSCSQWSKHGVRLFPKLTAPQPPSRVYG